MQSEPECLRGDHVLADYTGTLDFLFQTRLQCLQKASGKSREAQERSREEEAKQKKIRLGAQGALCLKFDILFTDTDGP
jgi:hypothetical protein